MPLPLRAGKSYHRGSMKDAAQRWNHAIWVGPFVTFGGAVSYFTAFAQFPSLRDFPWVNLPLVLAGLTISIIGLRRAFAGRRKLLGRILGSLGLAFSLGLAGLFVWYIFGISDKLPEPTSTTMQLTSAPDFTLVAQDGSPRTLSELRGRKVLLVFYRGHW